MAGDDEAPAVADTPRVSPGGSSYSLIEWIDPAVRLPDDDATVLGELEFDGNAEDAYSDALEYVDGRWRLASGVPVGARYTVRRWAEFPLPTEAWPYEVFLVIGQGKPNGEVNVQMLLPQPVLANDTPAPLPAALAMGCLEHLAGLGGLGDREDDEDLPDDVYE